jgi:hypothetical protein
MTIRSLATALLAAAVLLAGCVPAPTGPTSDPLASGPAGSGGTASPSDAAARTFCTDAGGMLVDRVATSNTNADPAAQLQLAGRMTLCEFETGTGDGTTRISVDLVTLSSEAPTLAAIAYLSKVPPLQTPTPSTNPAAYQCEEALHGTSSWGNTNVSGGWVDQDQPTFVVMDLCVFPDGSAIDQFGIWYYAAGEVRGADLATKFAYQPGPEGLPDLYERVRP